VGSTVGGGVRVCWCVVGMVRCGVVWCSVVWSGLESCDVISRNDAYS
jgi:hypothetical protein